MEWQKGKCYHCPAQFRALSFFTFLDYYHFCGNLSVIKQIMKKNTLTFQVTILGRNFFFSIWRLH